MKSFQRYIALTLLFVLSSCQPNSMQNKSFDIQGHRGCRGILPENSIPAFIKALELGVHTLEMDVVISKDHKVVVSHEPWISEEICLITPQLTDEEKKRFYSAKMTPKLASELGQLLEERRKSIETNIYNLNYDEIEEFDCGSKPHPRFPDQERLGVSKPLLSEVIETSELFTSNNNMNPNRYNIEIKRRKDHDLKFHPDMKTFADLVVEVVRLSGVKDRVTLQCFDVETLQYIRATYPDYHLVFLVENEDGIEVNMKKLDFIPSVYSPDFKLLDEDAITYAHAKSMKVIPWTVNEVEDMEAMIKLGVDGIITDYPNRLIDLMSDRAQPK